MNFQVIYNIIILILTTCFWCDLISHPLQENNYIIIDTIFNKIINKENYFNSPVIIPQDLMMTEEITWSSLILTTCFCCNLISYKETIYLNCYYY